ncbi:MAG: hypothetical protein JWM88_2156 [Verrucomicrobia bacterium]|nr:hypothetical protein [Verrucomicrobiota bacterium]
MMHASAPPAVLVNYAASLKSKLLLCLLGSLFAAAPGALRATEMDARHWQFFIDDFAVARGTGFDRIVHHPRPMGVVIPNDKAWETAGMNPLYFARKSDGTFICFYDAVRWVANADGAMVRGKLQKDRAQQYLNSLALATSRDGLHWDKPSLGFTEAAVSLDWKKFPPFPSPVGSSKENNLLGLSFGFIDLGQYGSVADPARRYALSIDGKGYFTAELPDFINDRDWRNKLVPAGGSFSPRENTLNFWDEQHQEWVAMVQNAVPHWMPSREIARFASKDLKEWRSEIALAPDPADPHRPDRYDEPMILFPYATEGVVLGLLSWIHTDRTTPDGGPVMEKKPGDPAQGWPWPKTAENPYLWPWARKGMNEMRITISRDGGHTWDRRSSRTAWIPHGTEQDSYDRLVIWASPPVQVGDEDWFYTGNYNGDHLVTRTTAHQETYYHDRARQGQIALYVQKRNRYVSLSTGSQLETLITRPFVINGDALQLNVDASRGRVRVGIGEYKPVLTLKNTTESTDPHLMEQNLLEGFTRDDCVPIEDNSIERVVQFKNGSSLKALQGRRVVLFIEVADADLYAFRVK